MGYYVTVIEGDAYIPAENVEAACRTLEGMFDSSVMEKNANGGSWSGGIPQEVWYSWVDTNTCLDLLKNNDLEGFLDHWSFFPYSDGDNNVYFGGYDSKTGNEDFMLAVIAPHVAEGTSLKWRGEEGEMWADVFEGGKKLEKTAKVVWE